MSIRRNMATAAGALVLALSAGQLRAQDASADAKAADSRFAQQVAADNIFEVRTGNLAEKNASNPAVKQFGQQMVTDHSQLHKQLSDIVSHGKPFLPGLPGELEKEFDRLKKLSGAEFDREYMTVMIQNHQNAVNSFQTGSQAAHSTQIQQFIASTLPTLQQHLSMAQQIGVQVGAQPVVATQNPPVVTPNPPVTQNPTTQNPTQNPPVANQNPNVRGNVNAADAEFVRDISADHHLEIDLGQLAQRKGRSSAVKEFGQRMVADHSTMENQWTAMATNNGVQVGGYGRVRGKKLTRLEKLSGREFDRAYMTTEIQNHQDYLKYLRKEGRGAQSAAVRNMVSQHLPNLEQHLSLAKQVGHEVGVNVDAVLRDGNVSTK
jgi:putative membrane protein